MENMKELDNLFPGFYSKCVSTKRLYWLVIVHHIAARAKLSLMVLVTSVSSVVVPQARGFGFSVWRRAARLVSSLEEKAKVLFIAIVVVLSCCAFAGFVLWFRCSVPTATFLTSIFLLIEYIIFLWCFPTNIFVRKFFAPVVIAVVISFVPWFANLLPQGTVGIPPCASSPECLVDSAFVADVCTESFREIREQRAAGLVLSQADEDYVSLKGHLTEHAGEFQQRCQTGDYLYIVGNWMFVESRIDQFEPRSAVDTLIVAILCRYAAEAHAYVHDSVTAVACLERSNECPLVYQVDPEYLRPDLNITDWPGAEEPTQTTASTSESGAEGETNELEIVVKPPSFDVPPPIADLPLQMPADQDEGANLIAGPEGNPGNSVLAQQASPESDANSVGSASIDYAEDMLARSMRLESERTSPTSPEEERYSRGAWLVTYGFLEEAHGVFEDLIEYTKGNVYCEAYYGLAYAEYLEGQSEEAARNLVKLHQCRGSLNVLEGELRRRVEKCLGQDIFEFCEAIK